MDRQGPDRISRRRMLKRIGAGAAVAWLTPVVTSFRTTAWAGDCPSECSPFGCSIGGDDCFGQVICEPSGACTCLRTTEDECFCHLMSPCDQLTPCCATSECPEGWACAYSCCKGSLCVPPCDLGSRRRRRPRGRTTIGLIR